MKGKGKFILCLVILIGLIACGTKETNQNTGVIMFTTEKAEVSSIDAQDKNLNEQSTDEDPRVVIDAPLIAQMPELPRGCEVTSLAMLLNYAGVKVDKMELAEKIKKVPFEEENSLRGNPDDGFVGSMYTFEENGLGVYHGPIAELANLYMPGRIEDLTGKSFDNVLKFVKQGKPVWVINTSMFKPLPEDYWISWGTRSGMVKVTYKEHSVLVTGYDTNYIYFNDPLAVQKNSRVSKSSFIAGWQQIGSQAISYK